MVTVTGRLTGVRHAPQQAVAIKLKVTTMTNTNDATGWYGDTFKAWQAKLMGGGKPTADQLATVHALGLRPGKQALANAMALRDGGVTGSEIVIACGAPQLNRMRGLIADKLVKREAVPPRGTHTVYKLTLTPKGEARVKAALTAAAAGDSEAAKAPAKPKRKRKPKPATVQAPAATPTSEAPAVTEATVQATV
jgi:hypothetical protein